VSINEVTTIDNPIVNPYQDKYDLQKTYLTVDDFQQMNSALDFFFVGLSLSDNLNIRSRQVYNMIEFISEISGFADIFFVIIGFLLGHFYTPYS
jgi:hypothetical protein